MSAVRLLPWVLHEAFEYVVGIFFVLAPFLFDFREGPAFPLFVAVGVVMLLLAVLTAGPVGIVSVLPISVHAGLDYILGFFLIVAPFVFGYDDVEAALLISVFAGVAHLVVSLTSRYPTTADAEAPEAPEAPEGPDV